MKILALLLVLVTLTACAEKIDSCDEELLVCIDNTCRALYSLSDSAALMDYELININGTIYEKYAVAAINRGNGKIDVQIHTNIR